MKVYVGTYRKYNEGSIKGSWLDLDTFKNYDEFVKAARKLHRGESDPEFMIQDVESDGYDWQAGFTGELISQYSDYWTVKAEAEKENGETAERIGEVTINEERQGVEIRFASIPSEDVRNVLKAHGWRWSKFARCWYNRDTTENRETAERIASAKITATDPGETGGKFVNPQAAVDAEWKAEQKAIIAEYRKHLEANAAKLWKHDVDGHLKGIAAVVKLADGKWFEIERPSITTEFCCGEDDRGQGGDGPGTMAYAHACCKNFESERGFKRHNVRDFDEHIIHIIGRKAIRETAGVLRVREGESSYHTEWEPRHFIQFNDGYIPGVAQIGSYWDRLDNSPAHDCRPITDDDTRRIRRAYAHVRRDFRRRVDAYWRRFGASKLHTWTYWTEA